MSSLEPQSTARIYFEEIRNQPDSFGYLTEICSPTRTEPFFEEEWIDFKGYPQDDKDAKKIWSKALSGYANITDGLIIWGIDARKTPPRDIDAASGLRLIHDPQAFESKLRDWIRDATNPPVMGVEYQSCVNGSGEGFVVCLIPKSNYKPHRAEFADKHYYFRAGDDFLQAEPGLLRTLFYPQSNPYLWMEVDLFYRLNPAALATEYLKNPTVFAYNKIVNNTSSMSLEVLLHNTGSATAKDVYIVVQTSNKLNFGQGVDWFMRPHPQGQVALQAKRAIHPGEVSDLFSASFQEEFSNQANDISNEWKIIPRFEQIYLRFTCYADNFQQQEIIVEFTPDDLSFETGSASKQGIPKI